MVAGIAADFEVYQPQNKRTRPTSKDNAMAKMNRGSMGAHKAPIKKAKIVSPTATTKKASPKSAPMKGLGKGA